MFVFRSIFVISSVILFSTVLCDNERKLSSVKNPDCERQMSNDTCKSLVLIHIQAQADNDTLHYIWDFTGIPAVLIAKTDVNTTLNINWEDFMNGFKNSMNFSSPPRYIFSSLLHRVHLFDDPNDKANIADDSVRNIISKDPHYFNWTQESFNTTENSIVLLMRAHLGNNGSIAMKLSAFADTDHGDELPHLFHSSQSMQLDIIVKNLTSNFTNSRIAVEIFAVTSELNSEGNFTLNKRRNLDDEFTPGIFDVFDVVSPRSYNDTRGAFFQYRPICYTTKYRTVSGSTELRQGNITSLLKSKDEVVGVFGNTLPFSYFGFELSKKVAQGMNITFGLEGDGFYSRTNYTSFSMLIGIGGAPVEKLSSFVITFASIGLGVPLLVLLIGGSYVAIRRYR